jgi:hypothetical protein
VWTGPLVREHVEVAVGDDTVRIFHGATLGRHAPPRPRGLRAGPQAAHVAGLWRATPTEPAQADAVPLAALGRSLDAYAAVIGGAP